ncbi:hypothetical protein V6N13_068396 [Hibiscus sabdariffa]|uniref:Uncharacterized protein n=1 Tax=Hibiscus sabdariffa TaxID=183260 RepID=A0ABR2QMI0_9ROSI
MGDLETTQEMRIGSFAKRVFVVNDVDVDVCFCHVFCYPECWDPEAICLGRRDEIASSILLVVDFGGWYRLDTKSSDDASSNMIRYTKVSLSKDVIVPYTHPYVAAFREP